MGLPDQFKVRLHKTAQLLKTDIRDLLKREGRLVDDVFLDELTATLARTDLGVDNVKGIVRRVRTEHFARVVNWDDLQKTIGNGLKQLLPH